MKKIILTGGGTGGHIIPNIALIPSLQRKYEIHYVGQAGSMEHKLITKNFPSVLFHYVECARLVRSLTLKNLSLPFRMQKSRKQAKAIIDRVKPSLIFSKGGYVSLPIMQASKDIPLILHESDYTMGLANRLVAKKCKTVCTSFFDTANKYSNGEATGLPIRSSIYNGNKDQARQITGLNKNDKPNLLIMGGSGGASWINDLVYKNINQLVGIYNIIHITGSNNIKLVSKADYYSTDFTNNINDFLAWADLCISRGGASAIFELVALNIPSLIIPLSKKASRGDQIDNAEYFCKRGAVHTATQEQLDKNPTSIFYHLATLKNSATTLKRAMSNIDNIDGTRRVLQIIDNAIELS